MNLGGNSWCYDYKCFTVGSRLKAAMPQRALLDLPLVVSQLIETLIDPDSHLTVLYLENLLLLQDQQFPPCFKTDQKYSNVLGTKSVNFPGCLHLGYHATTMVTFSLWNIAEEYNMMCCVFSFIQMKNISVDQ